MSIKVLYVDDEQNNLTAFKASFRRDYEVFTALSAEEGLKVLRENEIHVVFTDQRMPGTTGVQFLEQLIEEHFDPIRVLVTGYSDIEAVIQAINKGHVFRYIAKPWNEEEIHEVIRTAYKIYIDREEKSFFVYKASHDLKGPVISIKGLVELLKKELAENNPIQQYITLIDDSVNHLDETLTELIEFKRIGESPVRVEDVDIEEIVMDVLSSLKLQQYYNQNTFKISIDQQKNFRSDKSLLRSIFTNVVQNSIKYGRYSNNKATITVHVKVVNQLAHVEIKDNGLGMSQDTQINMFKMFYRGVSEIKGTGLGLYIVKTATDKLNGRIEVQSEQNSGSSFKFTIPQPIED